MSWANPSAPNLPDFLLFVQDSMAVPASALPAGSPWPGYAFNRAINQVLQVAGVPGLEYTLAVYNCAGHMLISITPDQTGQEFFANARTSYGINAPSSGVVVSSADQGTSMSVAVPEGLANLMIGDLAFYRTPWGRAYLAYTQNFGAIWGLT